MSLDNLTTEQQYFADSMKNSGIPITEAEFKAKFEEMAAAENLVFQNNNDASAWWTWLKNIAVLPALWLVEYIIKNIIPNQYVKTAAGSFLDALGWAHGIDRKQETKATGKIKFTRDNTGSELVITVGTKINTAPINGTVYSVITTVENKFLTTDLSIDVVVEAAGVGTAYNLAANYFVALAEPITSITSVTNESDWLATLGADKETDDEYRLRIRGYFNTVSDHHVNSVYKNIIADNIGFKYDRIFIDHTLAPRGAGSADAFVLFDVGAPSQTLLDSVNAYIIDNGYHGHGDDIQVKAMPESPFDLIATLWLPSGMSQSEKDALQADSEQMIRCAFRENTNFDNDVTKAWPASRFSLGQLSGELLARFPEMLSVEFNRGDIVSALEIPRINLLTVNVSEVV